MRNRDKLRKDEFYPILVLCGLIILIASIQVLMQTKDKELFHIWLRLNYANAHYNKSLFQEYIAINITIYYIKIISPLIILLTSSLTIKKFPLTSFYLYMWIILSFGGLAYNLVGFNFNSVFFYFNIVLYIILIIYIYFYIGVSNGNIKEGSQ